MWNSFAECTSPLNLMNIFTYFVLQTPAFPAISLGPKGSKRVFATLTLNESSQATCQCSPACRRLTIGVSVVVKLLAFSLGLQRQNHKFFVQRNWPRATTLEARHQNHDMIGYSKAPFCVYMKPTLAKTKWWKNQPKRSSLRTLAQLLHTWVARWCGDGIVLVQFVSANFTFKLWLVFQPALFQCSSP